MNEPATFLPIRLVLVLWLFLAGATTAVWAAVPASQWPALRTACHPGAGCTGYQLDASSVRLLGEHGVSLDAYALYTAAVLALVWLIWYGLAALIIRCKPQDRGALLAAFFLVVFPVWEVSAWIPSGPLSGWLTAL
jgi:hypothetical protein